MRKIVSTVISHRQCFCHLIWLICNYASVSFGFYDADCLDKQLIIALCRLKNALNNLILGWSVWCQFCCLIQHIFFGNLNCFRRYSGLLRRLHWWALAWLQLWSINFGCTKFEWLLPKSDQFIHNLIFAWIGGKFCFFSKFPLILKVS